MTAKKLARRPYSDEFEIAQIVLERSGGAVIWSDADYEAFRFKADGVHLIFYPHRSGNSYTVWVRDSNSKNKPLADQLIMRLYIGAGRNAMFSRQLNNATGIDKLARQEGLEFGWAARAHRDGYRAPERAVVAPVALAAPRPALVNLTLFTDASFCPETKAGGGAFWARGSGDARLQGSFPLPGLNQSHEAEIATACEAIKRMASDKGFGSVLRLGAGCLLILVVDCLSVKQALEGENIRMASAVRELVKQVHELRAGTGWQLKINHVKAHTGTKSARTWVNDFCDRAARQEMKKARKTILATCEAREA